MVIVVFLSGYGVVVVLVRLASVGLRVHMVGLVKQVDIVCPIIVVFGITDLSWSRDLYNLAM